MVLKEATSKDHTNIAFYTLVFCIYWFKIPLPGPAATATPPLRVRGKSGGPHSASTIKLDAKDSMSTIEQACMKRSTTVEQEDQKGKHSDSERKAKKNKSSSSTRDTSKPVPFHEQVQHDLIGKQSSLRKGSKPSKSAVAEAKSPPNPKSLPADAKTPMQSEPSDAESETPAPRVS